MCQSGTSRAKLQAVPLFSFRRPLLYFAKDIDREVCQILQQRASGRGADYVLVGFPYQSITESSQKLTDAAA